MLTRSPTAKRNAGNNNKTLDGGKTLLKLHKDCILKQGILYQKTSLLLTRYKKRNFVFDGQCLYRVRPSPTISNDLLHEIGADEGTDHSNMLSSKDEDGGLRDLKQCAAWREFTIEHKYVINDKSSEAPYAPTITESIKTSVVTRVVDARLMVGKELALGFFFQDHGVPPLFLMAETVAEYEIWLSLLQKAVEKKRVEEDCINTIHNAVEAMIDMALISDAFGDIQCVNKAMLQFLGYGRGQLKNHNVRDLMPDNYAKRHDIYLERFRKFGDKRLIGAPRELPVKLKCGKIMKVILSLGEIPDSTNTDKDRFLAVMKPFDDSTQRTQSRKMYHATHDRIDDMLESWNNRLSLIEETIASQQDILYEPVAKDAEELQARVNSLEQRTKKLLSLTSLQCSVADFLQYEIATCYQNAIDAREALPFRVDGFLQTLKQEVNLSDHQKLMVHILGKGHVEIENVMNLDIALRYFMIYGSMECNRDMFKFYLYVTRHYKTEINFSLLSSKREFIMEYFIKSGAECQLNISGKTKTLIEQQHEQLRQLESDVLAHEANTDCYREQQFFDCLLATIKAELTDCFARFRSHNLYIQMQHAIYHTLLAAS